MDQRTLEDIQSRLARLEREAVRFRKGQISASAPLEARFGGSDVDQEVSTVSGLSMAENDPVAALADESDLLVLGKIVDTPNGVTSTSSTEWQEERSITDVGTLSKAENNFGYSVAINADGSRAIVGAPYGDILAQTNEGFAAVYTRSGTAWTLEQGLTFSFTSGANSLIGYSVAINDAADTVALGAPSSSGSSGKVYVYTRSGSTWTLQQTLTGTGNTAYYGYSVALSENGNTLIVGDVGEGSSIQGGAEIWTRTSGTWTRQQSVSYSSGAAADYGGASVSLSADGNTAAIGYSMGNVSSNSDQGYVMVYTRSGSTWSQEARLYRSTGAANDQTGTSVSLSDDGNTLVVGSPADDVSTNTNQGSATIWTRSGTAWTEGSTLTYSAGAAQDYFGQSVSISGDATRLVVGTSQDDIGVNADRGSLILFEKVSGTWTEKNTLIAASGTSGDELGFASAISDDGLYVIGGAPYDDIPGYANHGSASVFTLVTTDGLAGVTVGDGEITEAKLAASAVTSSKIADGTIQTVDLADDSVTAAKIATGAVGSTEIATDAVGAAQIAADAVGSSEIATGAVGTSELDTGAVTSAKIADGTITDADVSSTNKDGTAATPSLRTLGTGAAQAAAGNDSRFSDSRTPSGTAGGDLSGTYPNPTIGTSAVGTTKIADGSVTSAKILDATIATGDLADDSVTSAKLADDATTDANRAVTTNHIRDDAITAAKIATDAVDSAEIKAAAVGTAEIADLAVTDGKLAGSISNSKLSTNPLARANHTGTQTASTVSDFDTQVRTSRLDQMAAPTSSVSLGSQKITNLATPTAGTSEAATAAYVESVASSGASPATTTSTGLIQLAGDLAGTATSPQIATGAITNNDVNANAGIALSKLGTGSSGQIIVANSSGVPTYVTSSGDATVSNTGATTVSTVSNARCVVYLGSNSSFTNNTDKRIPFDSETTDPSGFHDNLTNNTRLTVPSGLGGLYLVTFYAAFASNATGARYAFVWVNGGDLTVPLGVVIPSASGFQTRLSGAFFVNLSATQYVEINARQNSGGALDMTAAQCGLFRISA